MIAKLLNQYLFPIISPAFDGFLSSSMTSRCLIIFLLGWFIAFWINKFSRYLASLFDLEVRNFNGQSPEEHTASIRRVPIWETWFLTPLYGVFLSGIYFWLTVRLGVNSGLFRNVNPSLIPPEYPLLVLREFIGIFIFFGFLLAASIIDIRRKIIPDWITFPGTIVGLLLAGSFLSIQIPIQYLIHDETGNLCIAPTIAGLHFASPYAWPIWSTQIQGLLAGLGCWLLWMFALLRRSWYTRHGYGRAIALCWARIRRDPSTRIIGWIALIGIIYIIFCWQYANSEYCYLLSSLIGMAGGGFMIWLVRVIGRFSLRKESMGFGDVTLMSLIGAYCGWQATIVIFFLSPLTALFVGILMIVLKNDRLVPFGPFLCLGTVLWILFFPFIWSQFGFLVFSLGGGCIWGILIVCLILMGLLLTIYRRLVQCLLYKK